jgi:16S rRNA G1207 methylase RsmC
MTLKDLDRSFYEGGSTTPQPVFDRMEDMQRFGAMWAASRLLLCEAMGFLNLSDAKRIVDFGAGKGGPTFALALLAVQNGGQVDALEAEQTRVATIEATGMTEALPVRTHTADGIAWLADRAHEGNRYDLITGFMFGRDNHGHLSRALLEVSREALTPGGALLIVSDPTTMAAARAVCDEQPIVYYNIDQESPFAIVTPDTLVIPKS